MVNLSVWSRLPVRRLLLAAVLVLLSGWLALSPRPALAACGGTTNVGTEAALTAAINDYNGQAGPCAYGIVLTADITLTADLPTITNSNADTELSIDGNDLTIGDDGGDWVAFDIDDDEVTIQNITLEGMGIGIEALNGSTVDVIDATIADTASVSVFGFGTSTMNFLRVVVEGNDSFTAALGFDDSTVVADELIVRNNNSDGISLFGSDLTLRSSTISDNLISGITGFDNTIIIRDSTVSGNEIGIAGSSSSYEIINSTVAGHLLSGIQVANSSLSLINATVVDNREGVLAFGDQPNLPLEIRNSILANNEESDCEANPDPGGSFAQIIEHSLFSLSGSDACGLAAANPDGNGNIVGEAALLGPLGDYGGLTETIPPLLLTGGVSATSPAIDSGDNALAVDPNTGPLQFDQRGSGFPRIVNSTVDMGAFEGTLAISCPAFPATVGTEAELNDAILCYNGISTPGVYTINVGADITLTAATTAVDNPTGGVSLVIEGANRTLDGDDIPGVRPLTILEETTVTVRDLTVTGGNVADLLTPNDGGGIYNAGTLTLERVTVTGNATSDDGGGLMTEDGSTTTISDSTISDNTAGLFGDDDAPGDGGGINNEGVMTITNSVISGNRALGDAFIYGGGIYNEGDLTLIGSTVSENEVSGDEEGLFGGGIANQASLVVRDSSIINNRVTGASGRSEFAGGGISHQGDESDVEEYGSRLFVINSTVSGNEVSGGDDVFGGGIYVYSEDLSTDVTTGVAIINSTVSDNSVSSDETTPDGGGGGVYIAQGDSSTLEVAIANSILANSSTFGATGASGEDCVLDGQFTFLSFSTLYEATGSGACDVTNGVDGNLTGVDPLLGALGNNGGPTLTHLPLAGSLAIDSGDNGLALDPNNPLTADQRNFAPRIVNGTVDRGSVEVGALPPSVCPVDPAEGTVGGELTTLLGTGMGSPTRTRMVATVTIPNAANVVDLYGQMAAKEFNGVRYVRFIYSGKNAGFEQVQPETDLGAKGAISWWGADLDETKLQPRPEVKGRWFLHKGMKKMRLPRAIVVYATHDTGQEWANNWATFTYPDNFVAGTPGFPQTNTNTLPIPEMQGTGDVVVQLAVTDVNRDPRTVDVIITAGNVSETVTLTGPTNKKSELLNLFEVTLEGVGQGVDEVTIELVSVADEGDSAALLGAAAAYACEP